MYLMYLLPMLITKVTGFVPLEKCMGELGCFNTGAPFFDASERPVSLLPQDREFINTTFYLITRGHRTAPMKFSNMDNSLANLSRSSYDPNIKTKFIVFGYISIFATYMKMPLIDAILQTEHCNLFYVDYSNGDGPLFEQAVSNARVVGAEIAVFINHLRKKVGLKPADVHIFGHSLGAHIAGYVGKRIKNLGRITGMDPGGPYFTNVDPVVRLNRNDAIFVEAIHTNAGKNLFEGLGTTESIAHRDFFPNGGRHQPGCPDQLHAILHFLSHPPFFTAEGLRGLACNHCRSVFLVKSALLHPDCPLIGCTADSKAICVPMVQRDSDLNFDRSRPLVLFLNTTDKEPFCLK